MKTIKTIKTDTINTINPDQLARITGGALVQYPIDNVYGPHNPSGANSDNRNR